MKYLEINRFYNENCLDTMGWMEDNSIDCVVTSPPYYGLRDYGVEGQIGLEASPKAYVEKLVEVFAEVYRVLKPSGSVWLNLGDSYSSTTKSAGASMKSTLATKPTPAKTTELRDGGSWRGVSSNLPNCFQALIKDSVVFLTSGSALTITAERGDVLYSDEFFPDSELTCFFGVKRIFFKKRDNDFCQVLNFFDAKGSVRIGAGVSFTVPNNTDLEIILDSVDNVRVVVSDADLNADASLKISSEPLAAKNGETSFSVEKTTHPITESIGNAQTNGQTVTLDSLGECISQIDTVNNPIAFGDAFNSCTSGLRDFRVTKASEKQFTLFLMGGIVQFTSDCISHLYFKNSFGSLTHYLELYDKAKRESNATKAKQELGIPEMVKRALMEYGWICRQTIVWSKPNPMPESVKDRCTKAHEYVFLLTKSSRYYFDHKAIQEPAKYDGRKDTLLKGSAKYEIAAVPNSTAHSFHTQNCERWQQNGNGVYVRNKRSVWTITTKPFKGAHFATFPPEIPENCIKAGCPENGIVYDPFSGAGTVALVAQKLGRNFIGSEINAEYVMLAEKRLKDARL